MSTQSEVHFLPVFDADEEEGFLVMEVPDRPLAGHPAKKKVPSYSRRRFKRGVWWVNEFGHPLFEKLSYPNRCAQCAKGVPCAVWDTDWIYNECYQTRPPGKTQRDPEGASAEFFWWAWGFSSARSGPPLVEQLYVAAKTLGLSWPCDKVSVEREFRVLIGRVHPDRPDGNAEKAREAIAARELLLQHVTAEV